MIDLLLVSAIIVMALVIYLCASALLNDDEQTIADFNYCYGCPCGWCMETPDSDECRKWRAENEVRK
jgi:hypothetical protein